MLKITIYRFIIPLLIPMGIRPVCQQFALLQRWSCWKAALIPFCIYLSSENLIVDARLFPGTSFVYAFCFPLFQYF
jgi:hypothetical protein